MSAHLNLTIEYDDETAAILGQRFTRTDKTLAIRALVTELLALAGGTRRGYVREAVASTVASRVVTLSRAGAVDGTDEIAIGGTTLAVEASPANESEFAKGANDAAFVAAFVAAVNAHSVLSKIVRAEVTSGTTATLFALAPGPIGNLITLAETGNGFSIPSASLTGGASEAVSGFSFGFNPAA